MPLQIELLEGKKNVGAHEHVDALPGGPQLAGNVPAGGNGVIRLWANGWQNEAEKVNKETPTLLHLRGYALASSYNCGQAV